LIDSPSAKDIVFGEKVGVMVGVSVGSGVGVGGGVMVGRGVFVGGAGVSVGSGASAATLLTWVGVVLSCPPDFGAQPEDSTARTKQKERKRDIRLIYTPPMFRDLHPESDRSPFGDNRNTMHILA
jgi:hypothetical protein